MSNIINLKKVNLNDNPNYKKPKDNGSYKIDVVVNRVEAGVVGSLYIEDTMNKPFFIPGDIVHLTKYSKLLIGDFILYEEQGKYFIRRIIKFKNDDIYIAGDNENMYHKIDKTLIIAKAIARERKLTTVSLNDRSKFKGYRFKKTKLAYFRLKNRVIEYEQELLDESIKIAKMNTVVNESKKTNVNMSVNIDIDLSNFVDPDTYAYEYLYGSLSQENCKN